MPLEELVKALKEHLTPERVARIEAVAAERTRKICLVLEDIRQEHNIGALLRTADILGIQDVHLVSQKYEARLAKAIAKGSIKWINLHRYQDRDTNNLAQCFQHLQAENYQLVVADPEGEVALPDLRYEGKPLAVLMGSEWEGVSDEASKAAAIRVRIPQYGFTESFNVSVAAALILHQLSADLRKSDFDWKLSNEERLELELDWVMKRLGNSAWPLREKIEQAWAQEQ